MTLEEFIFKITDNDDRVMFSQQEAGYKFRVSRLTTSGRFYQVETSITHEALRTMPHVDPWARIYDQITGLFFLEMGKPYPEDPQQSERKLVKYVKDFIDEHKIHSGEAIYQSDWDTLPYEFMDKCCEIIGYYED